MEYIVFDLEWNQCPYGKEREVPGLPFEIIEIGAVKLNERKEYLDSFHALIRPKVYRRLHYQTSRVIGLTEKDLEGGRPFAEAADDFLRWCGPEPRFCTWGTLDLTELQRNLTWYHMGERLPGPILYEDVQKLFAIMQGDRKERRSLKDAVNILKIPEDGEFHMAKEDAVYTARVLKRIPDKIIRESYSIDCFRIPESKKEEIRLRYETYEKFISRGFASKEKLMSDRGITGIRCFTCGRETRRIIRYFPDSGGRNYIAVGSCPEHGYVKCKIRVRETAKGLHYAIRTTRHISGEEMLALRRKMTFLRLKRQSKRRENGPKG